MDAQEAPKQNDRKKIKVTLGLSKEGKTAIRVINNGTPIPADIQDKIFSCPFLPPTITEPALDYFSHARL
jgi:C4-dicarboxylate-specific signal transduction histidine kinase